MEHTSHLRKKPVEYSKQRGDEPHEIASKIKIGDLLIGYSHRELDLIEALIQKDAPGLFLSVYGETITKAVVMGTQTERNL